MSEYAALLDTTTHAIGGLYILREQVIRGEGDPIAHIESAARITKQLAVDTHNLCHGEDAAIDLHELFSIDKDAHARVLVEASQCHGQANLTHEACIAILTRMIDTAVHISGISTSMGAQV